MIALGCDHGGYELMQAVKRHLEERGLEYKDFGTYSTASCDYPVFGKAAAQAVAEGECDRGIVICSTGIGISTTPGKTAYPTLAESSLRTNGMSASTDTSSIAR